MHTYTDAEIEAMRIGIYVDPDADLCRRQREEAAAGIVVAVLFKNIYGWCVRDTFNDGLGNMSGNFNTKEEAASWAASWIAADPARRSLWDGREGSKR